MKNLGSLGVLCADEADDGALWFGCIDGVARYDGLQVERIPFDERLLSGIEHNEKRKPWSWSILCLQDGSLLALVESGLVHYVNGEWKILSRDIGTSSYEARLEQTEDGSIWVLSSETLWYMSEDFSEQRAVIGAKASERLSAFCRDEQGDQWVVRYTRENRCDLIHIPLYNGRPVEERLWSSYRIPVINPGRESGIGSGANGRIWFVDSDAKNGVWAFDCKTTTWEEQRYPKSSKGYFALMKDRSGTLWAEGPRVLLAIGQSETRSYYPSQLELPNVSISIYETAEGKWWVIGRGGHVYTMDPSYEQWLTYVDLHFECESVDGKQWFITNNRCVVSYDPSTGVWLRYETSDMLIDDPRALYASSHGLVWAAGSHEGHAAMSVFDGASWNRYEHPGFAKIMGEGGLEAKDGTMWFGASGGRLKTSSTTGGALQYEVSPEGKARFVKQLSPPHCPYSITQFAQTPDGALWLGAPIIYRYDIATGTSHVESELPSVYTQGLVVDKNQDLWVAKGLYGVFRKEKGGWRKFTSEDGFAGTQAVELLPLQDGTLLAATEKGINRFDGKTWAGLVFDLDFGMSSLGGNMRQSRDGSVWFNFRKKDSRSLQVWLNVDEKDRFCTVRYRADLAPPDTTIQKFNSQVGASGNSYISWSGHDPWMNTPQDKLQYSWRVDESEWTPFSYETGYPFQDLDGGTHTFEVRSRDLDFNIDPTSARSVFTVARPIWQQAWFVTLMLFLSGMIALLICIIVKNREKQLAAQQERLAEREQYLLEMDRLKTNFFSNISHELRTPLTVIIGPLQSMLADEPDGLKKKTLSMMMRNANRVATLITQLLDFRKLEQGAIQIEATEGNISEFIQEVVVSLQPLLDNKRVLFGLECAGNLRGWFDPDKLEKIVVNLVSNAIKYTPSGGSIDLMLQLEEVFGGRQLVLIIEDTGAGIGPEHLQHIFERFYRIPAESLIDGSGIGLNLTKELVELWGGKITAESPIYADDHCPGSRFSVRLPIDYEGLPKQFEEVAEAAVISNPMPVSEKGPSSDLELLPSDSERGGDEVPLVLVVEDDADIRSFISEGLESNYRIEEAANGVEAFQRACELVPDLVVTDLMMPLMDGIELCTKLKTTPETSHIPVVMLTAKTALEHQVEGLKADADDYLTKPFHLVLLQTRIANLLRSRKKLQERFLQQLAETVQIPQESSGIELKETEEVLVNNKLDDAFWQDARRVLNERVCDPDFNTTQFADALHMSPRSLQRKIKAMSNLTPVNLIVEFRLQKSIEYLGDELFKITDVAFEVGFNDSNHYYKQFKKKFGVSPSHYRSQLLT